MPTRVDTVELFNVINVGILHNQYVCVGINLVGCDSSGNVHLVGEQTTTMVEVTDARGRTRMVEQQVVPERDPATENLISLVYAAHGKPLASPECQALQAALTAEQWTAYQDVRKKPIKDARQKEYKDNCDQIILSALETALKSATVIDNEINVAIPKAAADQWIAAKDKVRVDHPYLD